MSNDSHDLFRKIQVLNVSHLFLPRLILTV